MRTKKGKVEVQHYLRERLRREAEPSLGEVPAQVWSRDASAAEVLGWET